MIREDYSKYYIQGSDHYLIPKDIFDELFNEMENWREESQKYKEVIDKLNTNWKELEKYIDNSKLILNNPNILQFYLIQKEILKEVEQMSFDKVLNRAVTGNKFIDKSEDEYIYVSLSQPPIKIISKNGSDDKLDYTVECPNCHRHVNYGHEIFMVSGHLYCSSNKCRDEVFKKLGGINVRRK